MIPVIAAFPRITSDAYNRVQELDPPSDLEDAHDELVDAFEDLLAVYEEGIDALRGAETMAEFSELNDEMDSTIITPAQMRLDDACQAVVDIGEANGIDVSDISCDDEE